MIQEKWNWKICGKQENLKKDPEKHNPILHSFQCPPPPRWNEKSNKNFKTSQMSPQNLFVLSVQHLKFNIKDTCVIFMTQIKKEIV